jgi:hypothetical protein
VAAPILDIGGADSIDVHRHLRTLGRSGSGPGEFTVLAFAQVIRGDSIAAYDGRERRITVFDALGNLGRTVHVKALGYLRHIFGDGTAVAKRTEWPYFKPGVRRETATLLSISETGVLSDTITRILGSEVFTPVHLQYTEPRPLGKHLETAIGDSLVYVGTGDQYEIRAFTRDGILSGILRANVARERVTRRLRNEFIDRMIEGAIYEPRKHDVRALRSTDGAFPETLPAHGSLLVGVGGELWVQDYQVDPDSRSRWRAFGPDGGFLAVIDTPPNLSVMSIGLDWVLGVWRDRDDVERVRLYALTRP